MGWRGVGCEAAGRAGYDRRGRPNPDTEAPVPKAGDPGSTWYGFCSLDAVRDRAAKELGYDRNPEPPEALKKVIVEYAPVAKPCT
jgi:hypothetical protein